MGAMSPRCPTCAKPTGICVCDRVEALAIQSRILILQHPEEPDEVLGTARLLEQSLGEAVRVRQGTVWPALGEAWGDPVDPGGWAVLWRGQLPRPLTPEEEAAPFLSLDRKGALRRPPWTGFVILDGSWSQARSTWWKNPWLLRLGRVLLNPPEASIYGKVRREPRRNAVSTLEAAAEALVGNGEPAEVRLSLRRLMRTMVQRARDTAPGGPRPAV